MPKEKIIIEAKEDQEKFKNWILNNTTQKFILDDDKEMFANSLVKNFIFLKPRIKSPYNDFYYWMKNSTPDDLKKYVDELLKQHREKTALKDKEKDGARLVYSDNDWKVYEITNYEASAKYGKGTKWCISGSKRWANGEEGAGYFDQYYSQNGVRFYFFINKDTKYALAVYPDNSCEIFNAEDVGIPYIPNAPVIDEIKADYKNESNSNILVNAIMNKRIDSNVLKQIIQETFTDNTGNECEIYSRDELNDLLTAVDDMIPDGYLEFEACANGDITPEEYKRITGEEFDEDSMWDGDLPALAGYELASLSGNTKEEKLNSLKYTLENEAEYIVLEEDYDGWLISPIKDYTELFMWANNRCGISDWSDGELDDFFINSFDADELEHVHPGRLYVFPIMLANRLIFDIKSGDISSSVLNGLGLSKDYLSRFNKNYDENLNESEKVSEDVYFHGSVEDIEGYLNRPINWITKDYDYAKTFALGNGYVYKCSATLGNLLDVGKTDARVFDMIPSTPLKFSREFTAIIRRLNISEDAIRKVIDNVADEYSVNPYRLAIRPVVRSMAFKRILEGLGYNGIKAIEYDSINDKNVETFGLFDQVKVLGKVNESLDEEVDFELPQYLYHATYKPFLKSIKEKGLGNTGRKMWSDSKGRGVVYLALDKDVAYSYAETAEWLDDVEDYDKYADNIIVLKIDTNKLDKEKLFIDENVLDNDSTVEYHGIIPFTSVVKVIEESLDESLKEIEQTGILISSSPYEIKNKILNSKRALKLVGVHVNGEELWLIGSPYGNTHADMIAYAKQYGYISGDYNKANNVYLNVVPYDKKINIFVDYSTGREYDYENTRIVDVTKEWSQVNKNSLENTQLYKALGEPKEIKDYKYADHINEDLNEEKAITWGDLDYAKKTDTRKMMGGRGTGHFGTGFYFVGKEGPYGLDKDNKIKKYDYEPSRPIYEIELDNYNLYKPKDNDSAYRLHDTLKEINDGYEPSLDTWLNSNFDEEALDDELFNIGWTLVDEDLDDDDIDLDFDDLDDLSDDSEDYEDAVKEQDKSLDNYRKLVKEFIAKYGLEEYVWKDIDTMKSGEIEKHVEDAIHYKARNISGLKYALKTLSKMFNVNEKTLLDIIHKAYESNSEDSISTMLMKGLGYEGVDVTHLNKDAQGLSGLDNFGYGTVVYDLKPGTFKKIMEPRKGGNIHAKAGESLKEKIVKKVANENKDNKVIMVYHGTNSDIDKFDLTHIKTEPGVWFTTDKKYAKEHGKNIFTCILDTSKIYDLETNDVFEEAKKFFNREITEKDILSKDFKEHLVELGFDGMCWEHSGETTFVVFNTKPIIETKKLDEKIVKKGSKWQVQSEKGKNLGTYDTKKEAEERLKDVEMFKHMNEDADMSTIEFAEKEIGTSDRPIDGPSYIMPDGKFLTIWRSKIPVSKYSASGSATHRDVQQFLYDKGYAKEDFWQVETPELERLGCIRVNGGFEEYIWLPDDRPNETQWNSLLMWLDWYFRFHHKLTVGFKSYAPKTYYDSDYTTDEILKKCKEAYGRGYLTEKIDKEDYQKKFDERTHAHIDRVNKYAKKINKEYPHHDEDKFNELYAGYSLMSKENVSDANDIIKAINRAYIRGGFFSEPLKEYNTNKKEVKKNFFNQQMRYFKNMGDSQKDLATKTTQDHEDDFDSVVDFCNNLKFPLKVYRGLLWKDKNQIDLNNLGVHWTIDKNFINRNNFKTILVGEINEEDVDWKLTQHTYVYYSANKQYPENEIWLKKNAKPHNLEIYSLDEFKQLNEKIVKLNNGKYQVQSEDGTKNLGTYDTKKEAEKRLQQVHYFKHMNEEVEIKGDEFSFTLEDICKKYPDLVSNTYQSCGPAFIMPDGKYLLSGKRFEMHGDLAFQCLMDIEGLNEQEIENEFDTSNLTNFFTRFFKLIRVNDGSKADIEDRAYFVIPYSSITSSQLNSLQDFVDYILKNKYSKKIYDIQAFVGTNYAHQKWDLQFNNPTSDEIISDVKFAMSRGFFGESLEEETFNKDIEISTPISRDDLSDEVICYRTITNDEFYRLFSGDVIEGQWIPDDNDWVHFDNVTDRNTKIILFYTDYYRFRIYKNRITLKCKFNKEDIVAVAKGRYAVAKNFNKTKTISKAYYHYDDDIVFLDEIGVSSYDLSNVLEIVSIKGAHSTNEFPNIFNSNINAELKQNADKYNIKYDNIKESLHEDVKDNVLDALDKEFGQEELYMWSTYILPNGHFLNPDNAQEYWDEVGEDPIYEHSDFEDWAYQKGYNLNAIYDNCIKMNVTYPYLSMPDKARPTPEQLNAIRKILDRKDLFEPEGKFYWYDIFPEEKVDSKGENLLAVYTSVGDELFDLDVSDADDIIRAINQAYIRGGFFSESLNESKQDIEKFRQWAGDELANRFFKLKDRLPDRAKDIYYWMGNEKQLLNLKDRYKRAQEYSDISNYEEWAHDSAINSLKTALDDVEQTPTRREINKLGKAGSEKIYEDDNWLVLKINTYEASVKYGKGTEWCITGNNSDQGRVDFNHHTKDFDATIYFFLNKKNKNSKYALEYVDDENWCLFDETDFPHVGYGTPFNNGMDAMGGECWHKGDLRDTFPTIKGLPDINKAYDDFEKYDEE